MRTSRLDFYTARIQRYSKEYARTARQFNLISWARLLVFVVGILACIQAYRIDPNWVILTAIGFLALFLYLVKLHLQWEERRDDLKRLVGINEQEVAALEGKWMAFDPGNEFLDQEHPFSYDMDLFGRGSVFQYLNRCGTEAGKTRLANELQTPSLDHEELLHRQEAVRELAENPEWRQDFLVKGGIGKEGMEDQQAVMGWLQEEPVLAHKPLFGWLLYLLPALLIGLTIAVGFDWISMRWPLLLILVNFAIVRRFLNRTNRIHGQVSKKFQMLVKYAGLLETIEMQSFEAVHLNKLKDSLKSGNTTAGQRLHKLAGIIQALDQRLNLFMGFVLNGLLLWDLQCVWRLEKWKKANIDSLPVWFEVIGAYDALVSLGGFCYNHPGFVFPEIHDKGFLLSATGIGHPLLDPGTRVDNDFHMEGFGQFRIITGANMAGKSTFLRTIGVNLVLGMIGAPVCAKRCKLVPVKIMTSVRMTDSLADRESYFFAELKRLKRIVDTLKSGESIFIIIDEMLKGTNSRDKEAGSKGLLEQLIRLGGSGLVATHDLSLGVMTERFPDNILNQRFEVEILEDRLEFDYTLKPGVSQNLNATFLMRQMGIVNR